MAKLDRRVTSTRALKLKPVWMSPERGTAKTYNGVVTELLDTSCSGRGSGTGAPVGAGWLPHAKHSIHGRDRPAQRRAASGILRRHDYDRLCRWVHGRRRAEKESRQPYALIFAIVAGSARDPAGKPYTLVVKPAKPGNAAHLDTADVVRQWAPVRPRAVLPVPGGQVCTNDGGMVRCANTRAFIGPC